MAESKLVSIEDYKTVLEYRDAHEVGSEGWKAAQAVIDIMLVEAVQQGMLWAAKIVLWYADYIEEQVDYFDPPNGAEMIEKSKNLIRLLIDNGFGDMIHPNRR